MLQLGVAVLARSVDTAKSSQGLKIGPQLAGACCTQEHVQVQLKDKSENFLKARTRTHQQFD